MMVRWSLVTILGLGSLVAAAAGPPLPWGAALPADARPDYVAAIAADYQRSLGALWDHFHRNPELSFHEKKTAARMAQELRDVPGMKVTEGVGGTGVVGVLSNGDGPTVLLRADMDGLPLEERSGVAHPSTVRHRRRGAIRSTSPHRSSSRCSR